MSTKLPLFVEVDKVCNVDSDVGDEGTLDIDALNSSWCFYNSNGNNFHTLFISCSVKKYYFDDLI